MALRVAVDTSFLIDLERERSRGETGPARVWLEQNADADLVLSVVAFGEFAEGFEGADSPHLELVRNTHELEPIDAAVALEYAKQARRLRRAGRLIGSNDLWIASTALRHQIPVVTRNQAGFRRVEGLTVLTYRSD